MIKLLKNKYAFTLVEILVAVGILAGSVATIMPMVEVSAMLSVEDEKMLRAVTLANNRMVELEMELMADTARGKFPDEMSESGVFGGANGDFSWDIEVTKVEIPMAQDEGGGGEGEDAKQSVAVVSALKNIMKDISEAVRELKVTVQWEGREDDIENEFSITTHIVDIK